jgi:ParB family chromosome partitioning protein
MSKTKKIVNKLVITPTNGPGAQLGAALEQAPSFLIPGNSSPAIQLSPTSFTGEYSIGQNYHIPIGDIRENKTNARYFYSDQEIDDTGKSISAHGQKVPAIGYVDNGLIYLTDGQKRWKASRAFDLPTLWVTICEKPSSVKDAYLDSRRINSERSEQTAFDDAIRWQQLLDDKVFANQSELAEAVKLEQSSISKTLSINLIPNDLRASMRNTEGLSDLRIAYAISSIFRCNAIPEGQGPVVDHTQPLTLEREQENLVNWRIVTAEKLVAEIKSAQLSARKAEALVQSKLTAVKKKPRSHIQTYKYGGKDVVVKMLEGAGKLDLAVKGLDAEKLAALHRKIQDLLKEEVA